MCEEDPVYLRSFLLGRNIETFLFKSAQLFRPFLTVYYMKSQKSTKAAALVALVVMTPLYYVHKLLFLFCSDIQNNFGTQYVLRMLRASEKDLPVPS